MFIWFKSKILDCLMIDFHGCPFQHFNATKSRVSPLRIIIASIHTVVTSQKTRIFTFWRYSIRVYCYLLCSLLSYLSLCSIFHWELFFNFIAITRTIKNTKIDDGTKISILHTRSRYGRSIILVVTSAISMV